MKILIFKVNNTKLYYHLLTLTLTQVLQTLHRVAQIKFWGLYIDSRSKTLLDLLPMRINPAPSTCSDPSPPDPDSACMAQLERNFQNLRVAPGDFVCRELCHNHQTMCTIFQQNHYNMRLNHICHVNKGCRIFQTAHSQH